MGIVKVESGKSPVVKTIKLSTDEIGSIVEDSDSSLWILRVDGPIAHIKNKLKGFESGFGSDNIQIDNYTEVGGLPGSYWSLFSFEGRFLLGTDKGIYKFDSKNKSFIPDSIFGTEFTTPEYSISFIIKSNKEGYWILAEVKDHYQLGKALLQKDGKYLSLIHISEPTRPY